MSKPETPAEETTETNDRKREVVAAILSAGTAIVLGIAAQIAISRVANKVHDRIAPKKENEDQDK